MQLDNYLIALFSNLVFSFLIVLARKCTLGFNYDCIAM